MTPSYFPITVQLPIAVLTAAVSIPLETPIEVLSIVGNLQALSVGPFAINVLNGRGDRIAGLSWSAPGEQTARPDSFGAAVSKLIFDVIGIGVGASGCYVTVWCNQGVQ